MQHTLANLGFYEERRARMRLRLEQIRSTMFGEDLDLLDILVGEDDGPGEEKTSHAARPDEEKASHAAEPAEEKFAHAAERLTDYVDELQRTLYACMAAFDEQDAVREEVLARNDAWADAAQELRGPADVYGLDVRALPTVLDERERDLVQAFFYCCLRASTLPGAASLRDVMRATASLAEPRASLPCVWPPKKLSYEDLLYSERGESALLHRGYSLWVPDRNDAFCLLDALYRAVRDGDPSALDDPEAVEGALARERFSSLRAGEVDIDEYERAVAEQEFLRVLTQTDESTWRNLSPAERYARLYEEVGSCDEDVLREVVDQSYSATVNDFNYFLAALELESLQESWRQMSHDERVAAVRGAAQDRMWAAERRRDREDVWEAELEAEYQEDIERYREDVRAWADRTQCADELFGRYATLRAGFFERWLPRGTGGASFSAVPLPLPRSFLELVETAVELLLGDEGVSRTMNDELYTQIFAYVDEAKYRMDTFLLKELLRRG